MSEENDGLGSENDGMAGAKRAMASYLTYAYLALGSLGGAGVTLAVDPFVQENVFEEIRRELAEIKAEQRLIRKDIEHAEERIDNLPPEWLRREVTALDKRVGRLEEGR